MKEIIVILAVFLLVSPAMASVDIVCTVTGPNEVTVSFSTSGEAVPVRMISLDVQTDDPNAYVVDVNCVSGKCNIYPASISIDAGENVTDWSPFAGVLDGNEMTTEQGLLYVGAANSPAEGDLFIVTLVGCTYEPGGDVYVSVSENTLYGGVIMEDPNIDPNVNLTGCTVNVGECDPERCPCLGDVSDTTGWGPPDGTVDIGDLIAIYSALIEQFPTGDPTFVYDIGLPPGLECADIDQGGSVNFSDAIAIYSVMMVQFPPCDPTSRCDIGCPFNDPF